MTCDYIRAGLTITLWVVLATFAGGAAYIAIRACIWCVRLAQQSLGL